MTVPNNLTRDELVDESTTIPDEETVRKAFGSERNAPEIRVLESGIINPNVTYILVNGKVPHTREDFYAVNVSTITPDNGLDNWLASGVFWTRHEAKSYIQYLKSEGVRF
jgi:hypothetical protein